jgi:hypothetical protein
VGGLSREGKARRRVDATHVPKRAVAAGESSREASDASFELAPPDEPKTSIPTTTGAKDALVHVKNVHRAIRIGHPGTPPGSLPEAPADGAAAQASLPLMP